MADGDPPPDALVPRLVDRAHAALADLANDAVLAEQQHPDARIGLFLRLLHRRWRCPPGTK